MKRVFLLVIAVVLLSLVACTESVPDEISEPDQPVSSEILLSEKERVMLPDVNETDLATLVDGSTAFAFDLYQILRQTDGNMFYSPYSISIALAMTYAGARGETEQQMADTLHFVLPQDCLHPAFNSLDIELSQRGESVEGEDGEGFRLNIVNAIWGQKDYQFLPTFLDILAENYGAGLRILDFINEMEESRFTINEWVSEQTEGRIEDLLPAGSINEWTRLVLTNAIYFNAAWNQSFREESTSIDKFYLLDGSMIEVPTMKQSQPFGYIEGSDYQAIELPYSGGELSMVIILPKEGGFSTFEKSLNQQMLASIIDGIDYREVVLSMPKFEFNTAVGLRDILSSMGMPAAFSDTADFSGISGNHDLFISDIIHKAFISVDEAGTEAAAATGVIAGVIGIPEEPVEVNLNRPFIFLIRDIETATVLFIGRVIDPSE
jgi:serpin B